MATDESKLIVRLQAIRRSVRWRLGAYGLAAVTAGGVAAFLTIVTADWLFRLPAALRMFAALLFLVGFVGATVHWIVQPLSTPMSVDQIAGTLEQHFRQLNDRLSSTVNFLKTRSAGSPDLVREVISNTDHVVGQIQLERALTLRPLLVRWAVLGLAGLMLGSTFWVSPGWAQTGFYRYWHPLGDTEWPRRVEIAPITKDINVALGESATVELMVERGRDDVLRPVVYLREKSGRVLAQAMHAGSDNRFSATIDAITQDMTYWFEAGDDSTKRTPFNIRAIKRPEVVAASVVIESPPYSDVHWVRNVKLGKGPIRAPLGGSAEISIQTNKTLPEGQINGTSATLLLDSGMRIPLRPNQLGATVRSAKLNVTSDIRFVVELKDALGFENRSRKHYLLDSYRDQPPTVSIEEPAGDLDLTPKGVVALRVRASDDYGLRAVSLEIRNPRSAAFVRELLLPTQSTVDPVKAGVVARAQYDWSLDTLSLQSGDTLTMSVVARDNYPLGGKGQVGRSRALRINIISDAEFGTRVADNVTALAASIRQILLAQNQTMSKTADLIVAVNDGPFEGERPRQVRALVRSQSRIISQTRHAAERFTRIGQRIRRNAPSDRDSIASMDAAASTLKAVALGSMSKAADHLTATGSPSAPRGPVSDLKKAERFEEDAVNVLRDVLKSMAEFGGFQQALAKTQDLLDRQEELISSSAQLERTSLGKPVDSLTPEEASRLTRLTRRQSQLKIDAESFLADMKKLAQSVADQEPSGAEAMDAALRAARAAGLRRHLQDAVSAIQANRTAAASTDQKAASRALRDMVKALRSRENRKLERLRKRLRRTEELVVHLLTDQRVMVSATREAMTTPPDQAGWQALIAHQRTLSRNTESVGQDLETITDAAKSAWLVTKASEAMQLAWRSLHRRQGDVALTQEDDAVGLLEQALSAIQRAALAAQRELLRRTLADIKEALQKLHDDEQALQPDVVALTAAVAKAPRFDRTLARKANRLSRRQGEIREALDRIMPDLKKVPVYRWAMERVADWMSDCRSWLAQRKINPDVSRTVARIVHELDRLIRAIEETQTMSLDTEFAEAEESGGGQGQSGQSQAQVPALAELIVLKSMQLDINDRTRQLATADQAARSTETFLKALEALGEDQSHLGHLTKMVTEKAGHR